jgi:kynurenine formamidase
MPLNDHFYELAAKVRNWGRWGDDDRIGTLNLIDDEARRRAAASVKSGRAISLALPLAFDGPQMGFIGRRQNPLHTMLEINQPSILDPHAGRFSDDMIVLTLQAATHWDGLAHASYDDKLYNGYPADSITAEGSTILGIQHVETLVGRGVLLDLARTKGVDHLEGGYPVTAADLDEAAEAAKVEILPGDIVLLRTGVMSLLKAGDKMAYNMTAPGPSLQTVEWFRDHDVAAVAVDHATFEVYPCEYDDMPLPVHLLHLVDMGLTQGQHWDLEALAADCADDGQYSFLLSASPEPIEHATGSPVNPVAVK